MKITKLTNSFTIENNKGSITQHALNTVTAYIGEARDSVTFKDATQNIGSAPVEEITVNGEQMTRDNIETLLEELFFLRVGNNTNEEGARGAVQEQSNWMDDSAKSVSHINNRPYTKAVYSDLPVFPTPICSGHIVEFYKDSNLYQSYQWNGWDWSIIGAEPNFIFTRTEGFKDTYDDIDNIIFYTKKQGKYSMTLDPNKDYSDMQVSAKSIEMVSSDYTLGQVNVSLAKEESSFHLTSVKAQYLSISSSDYNYIYDNVEISSSELQTYSLDISSKECIVQNLLLRNEISSGLLNIRGQNIILDNNQTSYVRLSCIQPDKNIIPTSTISVTNNTTIGEDSSITVEINGNVDNETNVNADIIVKNNRNMTYLNISSFNEGSKINTLDLAFDDKLSTFSLYGVSMTDDALASLIKALVDAPKVDFERSFNYYSDNIPLLTDDQKQQISEAGWTLHE